MSVTKLATPAADHSIDKAAQRLAAIEATATLLSIAYADGSVTEANPQIVAAAWDGIALLAQDATEALHGNR